MLSFRLFLNDKIEAEKTLVHKINRHIDGTDPIEDNDIGMAVATECKKHNIDYNAVVKHAKEMFNDEP